MKLRDLLSVDDKKKFYASAVKNEKLSTREWEEIIGGSEGHIQEGKWTDSAEMKLVNLLFILLEKP